MVLQPSFNVSDDLRAGRLVPLLTEYDAGALGIYVVYPNRKFLAAKVRSFIDTLVGPMGLGSERRSVLRDLSLGAPRSSSHCAERHAAAHMEAEAGVPEAARQP